MDFNVGGGVAVGTLILIEEDIVGSFANLMLRYFIAEGKSLTCVVGRSWAMSHGPCRPSISPGRSYIPSSFHLHKASLPVILFSWPPKNLTPS